MNEKRGKHALLVGIDAYPFFPPQNQLQGCVHDVELMADVLERRFGFPRQRIRLLRDAQATRDGILQAMEEVLTGVESGDVVVFHYSGHGSQMLSDDPREADGLDETLVPHDSGRRTFPNRDIRDKEIYDWIRRLSERTELITLILDSCHSGGAVRNVNERRVEPDLRSVDGVEPPRTRSGVPTRAVSASDDRGSSGWLPLDHRYVLIAGSQDRESACELPSEEAGGIAHGALTYHLCRQLLAALPDATYRDVFELAAPAISQRFPHQHPQLEGTRDRLLFGARIVTPDPYVAVSEREGDIAVLSGGAAHGLAVGSRWEVYPAGSKTSLEETRLGQLEVLETSSVRARALVLEETAPGEVTTGCRAIERASGDDDRRLVSIEPPAGEMAGALEERFGVRIASRTPPGVDLLLAGLDSSRFLRPCLDDRPEATFRCFEVRFPSREAGPEGNYWLAVDGACEPVVPVRPINHHGSIETLVRDLETRARYLRVLELENPDLWNPLRGLVDFELRWLDKSSDEWREPKTLNSGEICLDDGTRLALRIRHRHSEPLYFCVLDLGVTGSIDCLYPPPGAFDALIGERWLEIGTARGDELDVFLPPEYPFLRSSGAVSGTAYLKLLVTTEATDFSQLTQRGPRADLSRDRSGPLMAERTRDIRRRGLGQWLTLTKTLCLRRRRD